MGALSGLFDLSRTALAADQVALSTTANNVANQNTVGYTKQVVNWTTGDSVTLAAGVTLATSGPVIHTISRRDRVLEQRIQQQTQNQSSTAAEAAILSQIEGVFSLNGTSSTAGSTQLGTALDSFFSSLTALSGNPSDTATRYGALSAAQALTSAFTSATTQLAQVNAAVSSEIASSVTQLNGLTSTIAKLNQQIGGLSPEGDAGSLEDQRQAAIAQLSQLVGLDQISTEGGGITLTTQGGTVLVAGNEPFALAAVNSGDRMHLLDANGTDIGGTVAGGSLGGQLTGQNQDLPGVQAALDAVAYRVLTAVNLQNNAGTTPTGQAGIAIFVPQPMASGSAGRMAMIANQPNDFAAAAQGEGPTGNSNAQQLADIENGTDAAGNTISSQFAALLSQVGTRSGALLQQSSTQQASLTQLTTQRDTLSGVSMDEEASHLSQYQRAYQAAAKVLSVLDQLMASAINLGTPTTVS